MTTRAASVIGASSAYGTNWEAIKWRSVERQVRRLQQRIAKAVREGCWGKVHALQGLLTHSFSAKLMAVKRVGHNPGRRTPGVDRVVWRTTAQKMQAAWSLQRRGYRPKPLRRLYIAKKSGQLRPLSIPTMTDRAMQAVRSNNSNVLFYQMIRAVYAPLFSASSGAQSSLEHDTRHVDAHAWCTPQRRMGSRLSRSISLSASVALHL